MAGSGGEDSDGDDLASARLGGSLLTTIIRSKRDLFGDGRDQRTAAHAAPLGTGA